MSSTKSKVPAVDVDSTANWSREETKEGTTATGFHMLKVDADLHKALTHSGFDEYLDFVEKGYKEFIASVWSVSRL